MEPEPLLVDKKFGRSLSSPRQLDYLISHGKLGRGTSGGAS